VDLSKTDGIDGWSRSSRALEGVIAKVHSFGGRVEELTPTGLVAAFWASIRPRMRPAGAAHAAMAIQKLAARAREANGSEPEVVIGLHVASVLIGRVGARIEIDAGAKRAQWPVLDQLLEGRAPGETVASGEAGDISGAAVRDGAGRWAGERKGASVSADRTGAARARSLGRDDAVRGAAGGARGLAEPTGHGGWWPRASDGRRRGGGGGQVAP